MTPGVTMIICFDIGGSRIKAGLGGADGRVERLGEAPTPTNFRAFTDAMNTFLHGREVSGVAVSIAGCVDPDTGRLKCANIPCVDGRAIVDDLERVLGLPVWVGNDADCFALAEAQQGAGVGHRTVFGIILGTGVGGGLVIDGRIVTGAGGYAGEWGHGPVLNTRPLGFDVPHFPCGCGLSGCVDTVGGARGLERLHLKLSGQVAASTAIIAGWQAGDAAAAQTVAVWLELVSGPLAMVLNVVGASAVPVGGGLSSAPELIGALDGAVRARLLRRTAGPLLTPAAHRTEPGLVGAAIAGAQAFG
ncbi:N-acetylglucosamine kinase [Cereibacter changlensis]|nr:N-acetylglucosamine kinase [Cereibacter changlensis]